MKLQSLYIIFLLGFLFSETTDAQKDTDPPATPFLDLVSVNQSTGKIEISWSLSTSPDVAGYVVYLYKNSAGFALDTLFNPSATSYLRPGTGASYASESFVVAAIDSSGNISPLSNELRTIYTSATIDTCNTRIDINWNLYTSYPKQALSYSILISVDGAPFTEAANLPPDRTFLSINDFTTGAQYCFIVRANLAGGKNSGSNKYCLLTKMKRPPKWINANFATIMPDSSIGISFTIDPASEIRSLQVERRTGVSLTYEWIIQIASYTGPLSYIDNEADISEINCYRAYSLNNCRIPVAYSNIASNIVLSAERNENQILLKWNHYRKWLGDIAGYKIFVSTGSGFYEKASAGSEDSTFTLNYRDLMYEITGKEVCFKIKATEVSNPYGINGESTSTTACVNVTELITVPNTFTPDNNGVNDLFCPVLSFTPRSYQLIITDLQRRTVFESLDYTEKWDGTGNGKRLPEGVYLWFLKVRTPSGNTMTRTGSVTIIFNR